MDEHIKREATIDAITDLAGKAPTRSAYEAVWKSARALKKIPAADVAPVVHGRWEMRPTGMATDTGPEYKAYCTVCNEPNKQYQPPFCPHCGAKMDGERKDGGDG